jgi:hypothetical protein
LRAVELWTLLSLIVFFPFKKWAVCFRERNYRALLSSLRT